MEQQTITLGGKSYPIAPLKIGQMKQAGPCFTRVGMDTPDGMAAQTTIIYCAMKAADPSVTPEFVDNIQGATFNEIGAAVGAIAKLMGLETRTPPKGEAAPAEAPASEPDSAAGTGTA